MTMPLSESTTTTTTTTIMARPPGHTPSPSSQHVHKRRSSKDSDDELLSIAANSPPKLSRPTFQRPPGVPSLSPVRTSFHMAPPSNGVHARARSIAYSPLSPSPLSASFPPVNTDSSSARMNASLSAPELENGHGSPPPDHYHHHPQSRRSHHRVHSRNLSIYFPRPGSLPSSSISELEDGTQEVSIDYPAPGDGDSGRSTHSSDRMRKPVTPLGQGFTFGSKPPPSSALSNTSDQLRPSAPSLSAPRTRRGHHHKHSLSHNFFSFLEPGSTFTSNAASPPSHKTEPKLHTQPVPVPVSSWETKLNSVSPSSYSDNHGPSSFHDPLVVSPTFAKAMSIINLSLGATLWVRGQQVGSLACTGLGYWVVFDAIGLALSCNFDFGLGRLVSRLEGKSAENPHLVVNAKDRDLIRRPYGAARLSTLLTFAQSVYLMFSAVYVCKETIEHVLLSAGETQGHHHHPGDESAGAGLELPLILTTFTLFSLLASALLFDNNFEIVNITQTRIPSLLRSIRSFLTRSEQAYHETPFPQSRVIRALSNPFVLSPLVFCIGILAIGNLVSSPHQRLVDLLLASFIAFITFNLAYRACVILGITLLQTSPARTGVQKGQVKMSRKEGHMEAFLRAMRELEHHPHVLHLPAPHIWQIAPGSSKSSLNQTSNLVVTLEIHVRPELGDEDVLELTRWAWERVVISLGGSPTKKDPSLNGRKEPLEGKDKWMEEDRREEVDGGGPDVTVGIVRG